MKGIKLGFCVAKGTDWALGFGSFSKALPCGEKNIKIKITGIYLKARAV